MDETGTMGVPPVVFPHGIVRVRGRDARAPSAEHTLCTIMRNSMSSCQMPLCRAGTPFRRMRGQPLLQRCVDARLPPGAAAAKCTNHIPVEANRYLFLGRFLIGAARASNRLDGGSDTSATSNDPFGPIDVGHCGYGRGGAKGSRSRLAFLCGWHIDRILNARFHRRAGSTPEIRLDRCTCPSSAAAAPRSLRGHLRIVTFCIL